MLPDANSPDLELTHPTPEEKLETWILNSKSWGNALSQPDYIERERFLSTVPLLAQNGGLTHWILVSKTAEPNAREIYGSCESLRKPVIMAKNGIVSDGITHGIGSVFCNPRYRGKGYASRMMRELGPLLRTWQADPNTPGRDHVPFSILYSDIGKAFYAGHGWHPFPSSHIALPPEKSSAPSKASILQGEDIPELAALDIGYIRKSLEQKTDGKTRVSLLPDHDTYTWHHLREDFLTQRLFGKTPKIKGAIVGEKGSRVWAIWTRSFYGPLDKVSSGNTLYILRLVVENSEDSPENADKLKAILELAKEEAEKWKLDKVALWNPTSVVKGLIAKTGLEHKEEHRQEESIASLMWYGGESGQVEEIEWIANEKYGWC